ncbi:hypothetical protein ABIA03_007247 [Bradyrhizobium yuanmingense]
MGAGTVSTRNIVTSLEQLPQQCMRRQRLSLADNDAPMRRHGFERGGRSVAAIVTFHGDDGPTARFHRPFQPFDGFVDPLVVVLGIGEGLLPECIRLMQARRSSVHAPPLIRRFRPDRIIDDPGRGVVNIRQGRPAGRDAERPQPDEPAEASCAHNLYP